MKIKIALIFLALVLLIGIPLRPGRSQPNISVSDRDRIVEVAMAGKRFACLVRDSAVIPGRLRIKSGILIPYAKIVAQKIEKIRASSEEKGKKQQIEVLRQSKRELQKLCVAAVQILSEPAPTSTPSGSATAGTPASPTATNRPENLTPTNTPAPPTPTSTPIPPTPTSTPFPINGDVLTGHLARTISTPSDPAFTGMTLGREGDPVLFSFNPIAGEVERYVAVVAYGKLLELANTKNADGKIQTTRTFRQLLNTGSVCFYGYVLKSDNTRTKFKYHASMGFGSCGHGEN